MNGSYEEEETSIHSCKAFVGDSFPAQLSLSDKLLSSLLDAFALFGLTMPSRSLAGPYDRVLFPGHGAHCVRKLHTWPEYLTLTMFY